MCGKAFERAIEMSKFRFSRMSPNVVGSTVFAVWVKKPRSELLTSWGDGVAGDLLFSNYHVTVVVDLCRGMCGSSESR